VVDPDRESGQVNLGNALFWLVLGVAINMIVSSRGGGGIRDRTFGITPEILPPAIDCKPAGDMGVDLFCSF
jgi:hypothetical protein